MNEPSGILIRFNGSDWVGPESEAYENEAHLQSILAADPARIPGVAADSFSATELLTTAGPIDVCVVGRDGTITVVECKLEKNPERRRMVVGQVIDYAAAIWMSGPDAFMASWLTSTGIDLSVELDDGAIDALRQGVMDARMNLCLAVDSIDADLERLVTYLNQVTLPELRVTALQLAYAKHGEVEILIPSTFGGEIAEAKARSAGSHQDWTPETFVESIASDHDRAAATELMRRALARERKGPAEPLWFGRRPGGGIYIHVDGLDYPPVWLSINKHGKLMIGVTWNSFPHIRGHQGYAGLAALMGLDHSASARSVPVATFEFDELWDLIVTCGLAINPDGIGELPG